MNVSMAFLSNSRKTGAAIKRAERRAAELLYCISARIRALCAPQEIRLLTEKCSRLFICADGLLASLPERHCFRVLRVPFGRFLGVSDS